MFERAPAAAALAVCAAFAFSPSMAAAQHSPCVTECADIVVHNATVWTGVRGAPDASAIAVRGGRIVAVGGDVEVNRQIGPRTRIVDGTGKMVVPGFLDSHVHFLSGGASLASVQLRDAR